MSNPLIQWSILVSLMCIYECCGGVRELFEVVAGRQEEGGERGEERGGRRHGTGVMKDKEKSEGTRHWRWDL